MNNSLMFYPWCKRRGGGGVIIHTVSLYTACIHDWFVFQIFKKNLFLTYISSALSTSADWEVPRVHLSPVICQTPPPCLVLLFSCIRLSIIEPANSEKLLSIWIWIWSSTCETHRLFCRCCWITQPLVPHALRPDVQDNVTVKLQRKMVTGGKNFTVYIWRCFLFC